MAPRLGVGGLSSRSAQIGALATHGLRCLRHARCDERIRFVYYSVNRAGGRRGEQKPLVRGHLSELGLPGSLTFTVDWKLPASGMEDRMLRENFALLDARDTVKFVCGGEGDLIRMLEVSCELGLPNRVPVYLSPVFGRLDPARIVDFMQDNNLIWATAQQQLHKIIWPGVEKGV